MGFLLVLIWRKKKYWNVEFFLMLLNKQGLSLQWKLGCLCANSSQFWVELHSPFEHFAQTLPSTSLWVQILDHANMWIQNTDVIFHKITKMHTNAYFEKRYALKSHGFFTSHAACFHVDCCHNSSISVLSSLSFPNKIRQFLCRGKNLLNFVYFSCPVHLACRCVAFNYKTRLEHETNFDNIIGF